MHYYAFVTGELEKEAQTYQLWIQSYPQDPIPHGNLGANFTALGQYDKSLTETQEAQRLAPLCSCWSGQIQGYNTASRDACELYRGTQPLPLQSRENSPLALTAAPFGRHSQSGADVPRSSP